MSEPTVVLVNSDLCFQWQPIAAIEINSALTPFIIGDAANENHLSPPPLSSFLSTLGEKVAMSRATLVRHFQDAVGVAPMAYINNWRMMKAYNAIKHTSEPLEKLAASISFASARTLTRAFVRQYAVTPNKLRRGEDC